MGLLLVELLLRLLDQCDHIAHAEDALGHPVRVEWLQGIRLLPGSHKLDGFPGFFTNAQRGTATGVAIHLGENHAVKRDAVVEGLRGAHGVLTGHGIHHKQGFTGFDGTVDPVDLVHHVGIHRQASCGIDDDHVVAMGPGMSQCGRSNGHRVFFLTLGKDICAHALAHDLQLVNGCRPIDITRYEQRPLAKLGPQVQRQLGGVGGLPGALKAAHQNDARLAFEVEPGMLSAHEIGELLLRDLDEELTWLDRGQDLLSEGLLLDAVRETFRDAVVHVGFDEGTSDFLGGFGNVGLRDGGFAFDALKRLIETVAEVLKHGGRKVSRGTWGERTLVEWRDMRDE